MKKILFVMLFFALIASAFAVEITDITNISDQINTSNQEIIKITAGLNAQMSSLKTELINMRAQQTAFEAKALVKDDLPGMYAEINNLNTAAHVQILISVLFVAIFSFGLAFLSKAKGWL